jgi:hypothetical protein
LQITFICYTWCGSDKGMPIRWSYNWASLATGDKWKLRNVLLEKLN